MNAPPDATVSVVLPSPGLILAVGALLAVFALVKGRLGAMLLVAGLTLAAAGLDVAVRDVVLFLHPPRPAAPRAAVHRGDRGWSGWVVAAVVVAGCGAAAALGVTVARLRATGVLPWRTPWAVLADRRAWAAMRRAQRDELRVQYERVTKLYVEAERSGALDAADPQRVGAMLEARQAAAAAPRRRTPRSVELARYDQAVHHLLVCWTDLTRSPRPRPDGNLPGPDERRGSAPGGG